MIKGTRKPYNQKNKMQLFNEPSNFRLKTQISKCLFYTSAMGGKTNE